MKNGLLSTLSVIVAASVLGVMVMQSYALYQQFLTGQASFQDQIKQVLIELDSHLRKELNSRADLDMDKVDQLDMYYESPDSALTFVFESVTKKRNNDGSLHDFNSEVLNGRLQQFQIFLDSLENSNVSKKNLGENFIVIYGQKDLSVPDRKNWSQLVHFFKIDSLLHENLANRNIRTDFEFGIYNEEVSGWDFLSLSADTVDLVAHGVVADLLDDDYQIFMKVENPSLTILRRMGWGLGFSALLVFIVLGAFIFMLRVIMKQKKVSEIKNDFINNMTHEFKTPLATIAFATANIENEINILQPAKIRAFTNVIRNENKRMNQQVEQVLSAAISEKKSFELIKEVVSLNNILSETAQIIKMKFPDKKYNLVLELQNTVRLAVNVDVLHFRNAILNVLDNAHKYSPNGGEIRIFSEIRGEEAHIHFSDNGLGLSKNTIKNIFEKFYRVPTGNLHNIKGFGLGLNYSKAIIEQHGGDISVESESSKGSTFTIIIPIHGQDI